ncbi:hypothetical protein IPA_00650 [Ignicoccus pacificus DSM 13166]|uniref:Uncharacterized protein n=1 Tax=Ignicoccus pacificus DSM 13166 TaxID=940294 RepID=A0A977PKH6_9CREN|nr:hypothetical protein IPA_00650 [Ignicoccus pacificus DSM 13166]
MYKLTYEDVKREVPPETIHGITDENENVIGLFNIEAYYLIKDLERGLKVTFGALPTLGYIAGDFVKRDSLNLITMFSSIYINLILTPNISENASNVIDNIRAIVRKHNELSESFEKLLYEAFNKEKEDYDTIVKQMKALTDLIEQYIYPEVIQLIETVEDPADYERYVSSRVLTFNKGIESIMELLKKKLMDESDDGELAKYMAKLTEIQIDTILKHSKKRKKVLESLKGDKGVGDHLYIV